MHNFFAKFLKPFARKDAGVGLVSILVAAALLGIGAVAVTNTMALINKRKAAVEWIGARNSIKRTLLTGTACNRILPCKSDEFITVYSVEGKILVRADRTTRFGPFLVQAQCQANKTVEFRVAAYRDQRVGLDPITGQPLDWTSPAGVLIPGGDLCGVPKGALSEDQSVSPKFYLGPKCESKQGTCSIPAEAAAFYPADKKMCCPDGRDSQKPSCPVGTYELSAYWDRESDWGMDGRWAVTCQ